ncbi:unnamed protein product, partial [Allacma fusca]
MRVMFTSFT